MGYLRRMKLVLASNNRHKYLEIADLFAPHVITTPEKLQVTFEFEETSGTFIGNALGKAQHLYSLLHIPTLSDDSGLIVDALPGELGVETASYGYDTFGKKLSSQEQYLYLLKNLEHVEPSLRTARFVCTLVLILSSERIFIAQETLEGSIATQPSGEGGFGYDPVFIPQYAEKTLAALGQHEKNRFSHRSRAAHRMLALIETIEEEKRFYVC